MGLYREHILPRVIDKALDTEDIAQWRRRCLAGLHGTVVEPGFGSGLNVPLYPSGVAKVYAVDPSGTGRRLAGDRIAESAVDIEFVGLDGQALPLPDASCDGALLTFTLCTIPAPERAISELARVVRPGGRLHFLEHGLAPDDGIVSWQRRIEPLQKRLGDGCHLTRDMTELIAGGFHIEWIETTYARGPKPWSYFYLGRGVRGG